MTKQRSLPHEPMEPTIPFWQDPHVLALLEDSPVVVGVSSQEVIRFVSKRVDAAHPHDFPGTSELAIVHPDDRCSVRRDLAAALASPGTAITITPFRVATADGRHAWRTGTVRDLHGVPGIDGVLSVTIDISAQRFAEDAAAAVVALGLAALRDEPLDRLFAHACSAVSSLLQVPLAKVLELEPDREHFLLRAGVGWEQELVGTARVPAHEASQAGYTLMQRDVVVVRDFAEETRFARPDLLAAHDVESGISVAIVGEGSDAHPFGVIGAHAKSPRSYDVNDVTFVQTVANILAAAVAQRAVTASLAESRTEQERLLERLVAAEETERGRIAGEIHDDAVQVLYAIQVRLEALEGQIHEEAAAGIAEARGEITQTSRRLRGLLRRLGPVGEDPERSGMQESAAELLERTFGEDRAPSLHVKGSTIGLSGPTTARSIVFRRIAQETMMNARRHAKAANLWLSTEYLDRGILLTIRDDGVGCSDADFGKPGHIGLQVMHDRAAAAGGWLRVEGKPGVGTTVTCWLPVFDADAA